MKPINTNNASITVLTLLDTLADSDRLTLLSSWNMPVVEDILPTILSLIPFFLVDDDESDSFLSWSLIILRTYIILYKVVRVSFGTHPADIKQTAVIELYITQLSCIYPNSAIEQIMKPGIYERGQISRPSLLPIVT
jgi:hypothetical protein